MAEFRGNLYVFVDEFQEPASAASALEPGDVFELRNIGEMLWYLNGWAVGKNPQSKYCARTSTSKLRTFDTFAEAMDFVRIKRRTRPAESFHLVYEADGLKSIVTSLEQIQKLDRRFNSLECRAPCDAAESPEFAALAQKVGKIVAMNALVLLRTLSLEGEAAARARFSVATYGRLWRILQEAALVEGCGHSSAFNALNDARIGLAPG